MKRSYMTAILFILVLAFGLTACGGAKNNKETASGQTAESGTSLSAEPGDFVLAQSWDTDLLKRIGEGAEKKERTVHEGTASGRSL